MKALFRALSSINLIVFIILTTGCITMQRHHSTEINEFSYLKDYSQTLKEKALYQNSLAAQEIGLDPNRTLSEIEKKYLERHLYVKKLESNLIGEEERKLYFKLKPYLNSQSEQIQFLKIEGLDAKKNWAHNRSIFERNSNFTPEIENLIADKDITLRMPQSAVIASWGEPKLREIAGNPLYQNEKWTYSVQVPTETGYITETRILYFESGRIIGWDKY